jgi:hypothetical protein
MHAVTSTTSTYRSTNTASNYSAITLITAVEAFMYSCINTVILQAAQGHCTAAVCVHYIALFELNLLGSQLLLLLCSNRHWPVVLRDQVPISISHITLHNVLIMPLCNYLVRHI